MAGSRAGRAAGGDVPGRDGSGARVTVVIPTRNRAGLLRRSIESVLAQTYPQFELVVADNASEDDTPGVVSGFGDPRVRHVRRASDIGFAANFERSLWDVATEYVTILPDDDLMRPEKLEVAVGVMDANPSVGLLHSRFDDIDGDDRLLRANVDPTRGRLPRDSVEPGHRFVRHAIRTGSHVAFPTNFARVAALPSPRFDPADGLAIDLGLWLRVALDWDVAFVASPLAAVRSHGSMLSSSVGFFRGGRYVEGVAMVRAARDAKLRFLREQGTRFPDRDLLLRAARSASSHDMQRAVWNLRVISGRVAPSLKALAEGVRLEPRMLASASTYGLAGAILVGPAVAERARALASHPREGHGRGVSPAP